jgi:lipopolysaccharide assembly outer membrane protein LptD (OstA)
MKRLALGIFVAALAIGQTPIRHGDVDITANQIRTEGSVRHLAGHVTMETGAFSLRADQVDYNDDTGEISAHGEVRIKLK